MFKNATRKNGQATATIEVGYDHSARRHAAHEPPTIPPDDYVPTRDAIRAELDIVQTIKLSDDLKHWVDRYAEVGHRSGPFLWNWCRRGVEVTILPCVARPLRDRLADTKVLGVMLDVLIDDVADESLDTEFLDLLLQIPVANDDVATENLTPKQIAYAEFTRAVWIEIRRRAKCLPRFDEFDQLLGFDYGQLWNAMRYSQLLNAYPEILNIAEHDLYLPHNMHMMVSSTFDLMCSPKFDRNELGKLREAVLQAQYMGRIGNLITTWEREIAEGDFSSGVFARAISSDALAVESLKGLSRQKLAQQIRNGNHESYFLTRWQECRRTMLGMQRRIRSVDLGGLVSGLEQLLCLHLGGRGKK